MRIVKLFVPNGIRTQERGRIPVYLEESDDVKMTANEIGVVCNVRGEAFIVPWAAVQTAKTVITATQPAYVGKFTVESDAKRGKR